MLERFVVRHHIYPAIMHPPPGLCFTDQYAFRPTGSTTAAIIALLYTVRSMLTENLYVHVFALDFSKAFDTIRHSTLMDKMSNLPLQDNIYNWIVNFLESHQHCTKFAGSVSDTVNVAASVIQGSGLGPACYIVAASDLQASHTGNVIIKFADDTYLIVPAANSATCQDELDRVRQWAADNNLQLNLKKSKELLIMSRGRRRKTVIVPRRVPVSTGSPV